MRIESSPVDRTDLPWGGGEGGDKKQKNKTGTQTKLLHSENFGTVRSVYLLVQYDHLLSK